MTGKLNKSTLGEQVAETIQQLIVEQEYKVGTLLPSENALAAMFGVSRLTVRVGLQKLNALGLVETRTGEGTYVREFDYEAYIRKMSLMMPDSSTIKDISHFRSAVELKCIELLIALDPAPALDEIYDIYHQMEDYSQVSIPVNKSQIEKFAELDVTFHQKICEKSGNQPLTVAFLTGKETIKKSIVYTLNGRILDGVYGKKVLTRNGDIGILVKEHLQLLQAIEKKDGETAQSIFLQMLYHEHFDNWR